MFNMFGNDNKENIEKADKFLDDLDSLLSGKSNQLEDFDNIKNSDIERLFFKLSKIANKFHDRRSQQIGVYGELMLVCEKISDGYLYDRITTKTTNKQVQYIAHTVNVMSDNLEKSINEMLDVLKDFRSGNYNNQVNEDIFRGGILKDVIKEINFLGRLLKELSSKQQGVLDESSEVLAKMVAELANSSNEQALSIEQIAAAVDQISANIQHTSEKSINIQNISKDSLQSSQNGNILAEETLNAMIKINESTKAIASAIEMIDQIAFQTNILSLNAAVEAATAGEAGKGFAVVAGEVRNLATRSTEVAKEIKELVIKAQSETETGNGIVKNMSESFAGLNQKIDQTTKLIDDVTTATKEQHLGIEQISDSMNSLDNMTNQNREIVNNIQNVSNKISHMAKDLQ